MLIDEVYKLVLQQAAKSTSGGYVSPEEFNLYAKQAQEQKLEDELKGYRNSRASDHISNFIVHNLPLTASNGLVNKPANFRQFESAFTNDFSSGSGVASAFEELENDEWNWRLGSALDNPTSEFPALIIRDTQIQVEPKAQTMFMTYVKNPEDPIWNYVTPVVSRYVFDPNTSVDFTFTDSEIKDLTYRILKMLSIEIREPEVYQEASVEQQQTDR